MAKRDVTVGSTVAIVIGAREFPHYDNLLPNEAFGRSASAFLNYLQDSAGLNLRATEILDLFNDPGSIIDQDERISRFLLKNRAVKNVVVFYVGHGGFLADREYYLVLHSTRRHKEHTTGLRIKALAETLSQHMAQRNLLLILDCCFAGEAVREFQSKDLAVLIENKTFDSFPEAGTAMLVAASKDEPAITPAENALTMFSESFLKVLNEGIPDKPSRLSLHEVAVETQSLIKERYGLAAVRPEIHSPRQKGVDVAEIPFFPNRAIQDDGSDVKGARLKLILYELRVMPPRGPSQEYLGRIRELLDAAPELNRENRAALFDDLDRLETAVLDDEHRDIRSRLEKFFYRNLLHALRGPLRGSRQELLALPEQRWSVVYDYYREICDDPRQWLVCVALNKLFVARKDRNAIPLLQEMIQRDPDPNNNFTADCIEAGRRILGRREFDAALSMLFGYDFMSRWVKKRRAVDPLSDPEPERNIPTAIPRSRPDPVAKSYPGNHNIDKASE